MLFIVEGLDKSGKSTIANLIAETRAAVIIRKMYNSNLYPIDYSAASIYDWQAILDRVILANPAADFVADRSFFTQTMYQICLGSGEHAITNEQYSMFNNYCKVVKSMPHLIIYCRSAKYELDSMVTSIRIKHKIDALYQESLQKSELNHLILNTHKMTLRTALEQINNKAYQIEAEMLL